MIANATSCITSVEALPLATSIGEGTLLTGPKISTAYNIPAGTGAGVKVGIISLGGGYSQSDLNRSLADLGLTAPTVTFVPVDGTTNSYTGNPGSADGENALDLVCVASMVPQANIVLYTGQNGFSLTTDPITAAAANRTCGFANVLNRAVNENCDIITISWGAGEKFIIGGTTYYCGDYMSSALANASANGTSVFVATGDYGSEPTSGANIVAPQYPATNSNIIAVGGTYLSLFSGNTARSSETVYNNSQLAGGFGGGGGVSTTISVPSWQTGLTYKQYFTANSTIGPSTLLSGRGIPDISAAMNSYGVWINGTVYGFSGTSASAPIMAGIFARYISIAGRRPIPNSIHPVLYGNLNAYYDIASGNNATIPYINGYAASSNWDPVTGLGVPNGNVVYQMVSSGGTVIKTAANAWNYVANVQVKTAPTTWSNVRAIWTKTINGWSQAF